MKYCPNCGKENAETAEFCKECGNAFTKVATPKVSEKQGKSIASMILGIIAILWSLIALAGLGNLNTSVIQSINESNPENIGIFKAGFFVGYNFISLPCGIIGLILGLISKKNVKAIIGIVLSSVALLIACISLVIIIATQA